MAKAVKITRGSGNIFSDLGLPDADAHMLKARVVIFIKALIEQRQLSQTEAAKLMGLAQPDVSKLLRGRFEGFSLERLLEFVRALGSDVEIKVKSPAKHGREGRMSLMVA
jgi:predicted XRE-type DNA-binding protein